MQTKNNLQNKINQLSKNLASFYNNQDYKAMENGCLEMLKLIPNDYDTLLNLGVAYVKQNDFENAKKYFQKAIALNPKKGNGYINLGTLYENNDLKSLAIEVYKKAIYEFNCDERIIYTKLGVLLLDLEKYENAKEVYTKMLTKFPNDFN